MRAGRNIAAIIEIAARNELLRQAGHHPAREFVERVESGVSPHESVGAMPAVRVTSTPESSAPPPVERRRDK